MKDKKVYIVVLNYRGWQDTIACLESIHKLNYPDFNIIVVDNDSDNDSVDHIISWANGNTRAVVNNMRLINLVEPNWRKPLRYKIVVESDILYTLEDVKLDLTIIKAASNKGFSAGNNIGIRYILGKKDAAYIWLLNNDTLVENDALKHLVDFYRRSSVTNKVGIVGSKLLYYDNPDIIQCLGGATYNPYFGIVRQVCNGQPDCLVSNQAERKIDYVSGASMFVPVEFVNDVGLLCEDYFLYYEEIDWCTRGNNKGWAIGYNSLSIVYHKEGATLKAKSYGSELKSEKSDFYYVRNKLMYTDKYKSIVNSITVRISLLFTIINRIKRRQFSRVFMILSIAFSRKFTVDGK